METGDLTHTPSEPSLHKDELPLRRSFYPLGFHLNLATNSHDVLECAEESWGMWTPEFGGDPVEVQVLVQEEGDLAPEPHFSARAHLFSIVSDRHNYAVMDLDRLFGYAFISRKTATDHAWFRWFFLDTLGLFMLAQRHAMALHTACVAREGRGILLAGESCAGKSTLAWACARAGWTYLADDAVWLHIGGNGREILGRPYQVRLRDDAPRHFPELEGYLSRVRPNGKLNIEILTSAFPHIRTASRCDAAAVVFLDRGARCAPGFEPMDSQEVAGQLVARSPLHREELQVVYRDAVRRLLEVPAYRMHYQSLEEGLSLLEELDSRLRH